MAYGILKVDTIIFDQGGADQNATVSGIYRAITSGVTVSGTISGAVLVGTTTVSGTTVTGTTANFASGVFTTQVSGATVTGTQSSFTSGNFVTLSGTTAIFTSGVIASGTVASPSLSILGDPNTGIFSPDPDELAVATSGTKRLDVNSSGQFRIGNGGHVGIFSAQAAANGNLHIRDIASVIGSGTGVALDVLNDAGSAVQDLAIRGTNTIFRNSASETLRITSGGLVGIGTSAPNYQLHVTTDFAIGASGFNQQLTFGNDTIQSLLLGTGYTALKLNPLGGNVGIGTSSPSTTLEINGITTVRSGAFGQGGLKLNYTSSVDSRSWYVINDVNAYGDFAIQQSTTQTGSTYSTRLCINPSGNVGIGTTSPLKELQINATTPTIRLEENGGGSKRLEISIDSSALARIDATQSSSQLLFGTAGSERARIDTSGRLLVGQSTNPGGYYFVVNTGSGSNNNVVQLSNNANAELNINLTSGVSLINANVGILALGISGTERARIDTSGRLLVGTSTARSNFFDGASSAALQLEGNSTGTASLSITRNDATADGNALILAKARSTAYAILQYVNGTTSDDRIGRISFQGADGTNMVPAANIEAFVDGTPGANDMPGRLVFSTTADGAASPTERLRITAAGNVGIGTSSPTTLLDVNADTVRVRTARTPASASATGATGEICWDANYIYVCTATNTWKRSAIATW